MDPRESPAGHVDQGRIPLAALRESLTPSPRDVEWTLANDDCARRVLTMYAGRSLSFPLRLDHDVRLQGTVALVFTEWLEGASSLEVWVEVTGDGGARHRIWQRALRPAAGLGLPEGETITASIPADATELVLGADRDTPTDSRAVTRAVWIEPELVDERFASGTEVADHRPAGVVDSPGPDAPLFSVLTPVHDPPPAMLDAAIASVRAQTWPCWELCLADDGSTDPAVGEVLRRHAAEDDRITIARHERAGGISAATNLALAGAGGEYIVPLDHDDTLAPDALAVIAGHVHSDPTLDMIYSDEAIVQDARVTGVYRKPGWGLEGLQCLPYAHHLGAYRTALVRELGGLRSRYDGCQDYDLELRIAERSDRVLHIPEVLYRWHAHAASTAGGEMAKPWAYLRQRDALVAHLQRIGVEARVEFSGRTGTHRIVHRVDPTRPATFVCATADPDGVAAALRSWTAGPHREWDAVVAAPPPIHERLRANLRADGLDASRVTLIEAGGDAAGLAAAAQAARGDLLVLMPEPCLALDRDCLTRLLGYAALPAVGAAGAVVHAADGRIAEAGIAVPEGVPLARLRGLSSGQAGQIAVNVSAVDTVLATARATYERVGPLDPAAGPLTLVDYALRAGGHRLRAVVLGDVRVREPLRPRVNDLTAMRRLRAVWSAAGGGDPHHHPAFRTDRGDLRVR